MGRWRWLRHLLGRWRSRCRIYPRNLVWDMGGQMGGHLGGNLRGHFHGWVQGYLRRHAKGQKSGTLAWHRGVRSLVLHLVLRDEARLGWSRGCWVKWDTLAGGRAMLQRNSPVLQNSCWSQKRNKLVRLDRRQRWTGARGALFEPQSLYDYNSTSWLKPDIGSILWLILVKNDDPLQRNLTTKYTDTHKPGGMSCTPAVDEPVWGISVVMRGLWGSGIKDDTSAGLACSSEYGVLQADGWGVL